MRRRLIGQVVQRKRVDKVKPASGRLVREIDNSEETFSIDYHILGIQDTTGGFTNGYFADAQMSYRSPKYNEKNYALCKTSCDKKIISTTETQKLETLMTALSHKHLNCLCFFVRRKRHPDFRFARSQCKANHHRNL